MPPQFDHERLKAYQADLRFVAWAGPIIENLPPKLSARDQLDRASTSIPLNLAEGNGKRSYPDRCRYFDLARGSARAHLSLWAAPIVAGVADPGSGKASSDRGRRPRLQPDSGGAGFEKENE
jgi:hypothetical protein